MLFNHQRFREVEKMNKNTIILIIVLLVLGILIGYFVLPILVKSAATTGENVFGSSSGISPPAMP
jgi:flagellar basal body-associated protein FliL